MIRISKAAGIMVALIAVASVALAPTAGAMTFTSGASSGAIKITSTGTTITLPSVLPAFGTGGKLECASVVEEGTYTSAAFSQIEVTPTYSGCKFFGYLNGAIQMNGCKYVYKGENASKAAMSIVCPAGKDITIVVGNGFCVIHIAGGQTLGYVSFATNGSASPDDVSRTLAVTGLFYRQTNGCVGEVEPPARWNGEISGTSTVQAFNVFGTQVSLTVD